MQQRWGATAFETPHDLDRIGCRRAVRQFSGAGILGDFWTYLTGKFRFFCLPYANFRRADRIIGPEPPLTTDV